MENLRASTIAIIATLFLAFFACSVQAEEYPEEATSNYTVQTARLNWAIESFEPFYIQNGVFKGRGTADRLIDLLVAELPEYRHQRKPIPIMRIIEELRNGSNIVCISFLFDRDVLNFAQFSDPVFVVPPLEIVMRRTMWENSLGGKSPLSLRKLLQSNKFKLGFSKGRNFGDTINTILAEFQREHPVNMHVRSGDHFKGLAQMLVRNRIDLTIAYSGEANYFSQVEKTGEELVSIPILENSNALIVYAIAPRTPWGDSFMDNFNRVLPVIKQSSEYRATITDWFDPTSAFENMLHSIAPER